MHATPRQFISYDVTTCPPPPTPLVKRYNQLPSAFGALMLAYDAAKHPDGGAQALFRGCTGIIEADSTAFRTTIRGK